eukprot:scaffold54853_cov58-Phaeocystis_antarctica.AAC.4
MLPPVWCASHVVGEKPSQAAWDRPWVPWEGCRPRRAFPATWLMAVPPLPNRWQWWHGGWQPAAVPPVGHQPRHRTHAVAPPNRSSTLGHRWVPAADRPDAFEDHKLSYTISRLWCVYCFT